MDVWLTRSGRLLARFWAPRYEVDWQSYEIIGLSQKNKKRWWDAAGEPDWAERGLSEDWVPQCLRDEYDNWIISEF